MGKIIMSGKSRQAQSLNRKEDLIVKMPEPRGSALLVLMEWLGFLVLLLVAAVAAANWTSQSGRQILTRQCLDTLAEALVAYKQVEGEFPPTVASTGELMKYLKSVPQAQQRLEQMAEHIIDPTSGGQEILDGWSRPLRYVFDSGAGQRPELKSQGPDPNDPADDIYAPALQAVFIDNSAKAAV